MPHLLLPPDLLARLAHLRGADDLIAFIGEQPGVAPYIRQVLLEVLEKEGESGGLDVTDDTVRRGPTHI